MGAPLSSLQPCIYACDNCLFKDEWVELDVSQTAHDIVNLFRSRPVRRKNGVTNVEYIVNTLRGCQGDKVLSVKKEIGHLFGVARDVHKRTVQTVFGLLLAHGVLRGDPIKTKGVRQWNKALRFKVRGLLMHVLIDF